MGTTALALTHALGRLRRASQRTPIGLDVGAERITAVQLVVRREDSVGRLPPCELEHVATAARLADEDEPSCELAERDIALLRRLQQHNRFAGRSVVVGLNTPLIDIQSLALPTGERGLEDRNVDAALRFELSRQLNYDVANAEVRSWVLPPSMGAGPNVIGVACRRNRLQQMMRIASAAGLLCRRVELGCLALVRACLTPDCLQQPTIWGVLDLGHLASRLTLVVQATPVLHRGVQVGGRRLSSLIAQRLRVGQASAEQLKRCHGLDSEPGQGVPPAGKVPGADQPDPGRLIFASLRRELVRLATEVERSFSYVIHLYPEAIVGRLWLAGGSARLKGLDRFLAERIGISVSVARPPTSRGPAVDGGSDSWANDPGLMQAVGLALLGLEN